MLPRAALRCKLVQSTGGIASPAGVFRGDRISSLPTNACSTEICGEGRNTISPKNACGGATGGTDCTRAAIEFRPLSLFINVNSNIFNKLITNDETRDNKNNRRVTT